MQKILCAHSVPEMKFTSSNQILDFFFFKYILRKTEKFTGPNKVLMVMDQRTGAHCVDCIDSSLSS